MEFFACADFIESDTDITMYSYVHVPLYHTFVFLMRHFVLHVTSHFVISHPHCVMSKSHLQDMAHVLCIPLTCVGTQVVAYTVYMYVTPPYISSIVGLHMLLLMHALIPSVAAYILHLFLYVFALSSLHPSTF